MWINGLAHFSLIIFRLLSHVEHAQQKWFAINFIDLLWIAQDCTFSFSKILFYFLRNESNVKLMAIFFSNKVEIEQVYSLFYFFIITSAWSKAWRFFINLCFSSFLELPTFRVGLKNMNNLIFSSMHKYISFVTSKYPTSNQSGFRDGAVCPEPM